MYLRFRTKILFIVKLISLLYKVILEINSVFKLVLKTFINYIIIIRILFLLKLIK